MSSLIERIKEHDKQFACNHYVKYIQKNCKQTNTKCKYIKQLIKKCNKPKAII